MFDTGIVEKKEPPGAGSGRDQDIPASVEEAKDYFLEQHSTAAEAEKFFNRYQDVG